MSNHQTNNHSRTSTNLYPNQPMQQPEVKNSSTFQHPIKNSNHISNTSPRSQKTHNTEDNKSKPIPNHIPNFLKNASTTANKVNDIHPQGNGGEKKPLKFQKISGSMGEGQKPKIYRPPFRDQPQSLLNMELLVNQSHQENKYPKKQQQFQNGQTLPYKLHQMKPPEYHNSFPNRVINGGGFPQQNYIKDKSVSSSVVYTKMEERSKTTANLFNSTQYSNNSMDSPSKKFQYQPKLPSESHQFIPLKGTLQGKFNDANTHQNPSKIPQKVNYPQNRGHNKWTQKSMQGFQKIKQLGSGHYGNVVLVRQRQTGFICAIKQIKKSNLLQQGIVQQFIRQIKIQMFLNHPNIMKMYGFFHNETDFNIILEVGIDKQLMHLLQKCKVLPEVRVAALMRQVCNAVQALHYENIIHRDLKPENIVLHENVVKLCDFGWSVHQNNQLRTTFCGTPLYVCPQILKGTEYNEKVDIWALGIMTYQMLIGQIPFKITRQEQLAKIIQQEVVIPSHAKLSKEATNFLQLCLQKKPQDRTSIRHLVQHQFFKKYPDKQAEKNKVFGIS